MRKFIIAAGLLASTAAVAANIPYDATPFSAGGLTAAVNRFILNFNAGVSGVLFSTTAAKATTTTGPDTMYTVTLPANTFKFGQTLKFYAYGVNSADANAKTITFNFGAAGTCAVIVTGSGVNWFAEAFVTELSGSNQYLECHGQHGTVRVTSAQSATTEDPTTDLSMVVTATAATAGTTTINQLVASMLR